MPDPHLFWITRLLRGEIIAGEAGVRLRDGPFDKRIHIVRLDEDGKPPASIRGRRGSGVRHQYRLVIDESAPHGWIYEYEGSKPDDVSRLTED